jgi:hypothetical protein
MKIIYIMREQRDLQIQTTQQMQTTAAQITGEIFIASISNVPVIAPSCEYTLL